MDVPFNKILVGDAAERLKELPDGCIHTCVTSPPYFGLRNYGVEGQIGLEETPDEYVSKLVKVFHEVRRVLRDDGTLWLNLGDSYSAAGYSNHKNTGGAQREEGGKPKHLMGSGLKPKNLLGIPWRVAFALQADEWYLRSDIIWAKPNPMPESVVDRPSKAHEYIFLLAKSERYFYDVDAIRESVSENERPQQKRAREIAMEAGLTPSHLEAIRSAGCTDAGKAMVTQTGTGKNTAEVQKLAKEAKDALGGYYREFLTQNARRNRRTVWSIATEPFPEAHFATFPQELVEPCVAAGTSEKGCCPSCRAPWTRLVEESKIPDRPNRVQERKGDSIDEAHGSDGRAGDRWTLSSRTVGWSPSCSCAKEQTEPCMVLDPFMGSGTTALVALKAGRNFLGIELNPEYAKICEGRISQERSQMKLF